MKAVRVHRFGGIDAIEYEEVAVPAPGAGQVLVEVRAAGVGPWDAWVREGKSALPQPLPLTLGSDLSGVVESVGPGVSAFRPGEEVFGVTNARFTGANAEYAVAEAGMLAAKPRRLTHLEAASVPVVASTAWQMVWDHGAVGPAKVVLVHGAAGNVGAYAVQLAKRAGARVLATVRARDADRVRALGADRVIDADAERFEEAAGRVDVVLDTLGGAMQTRSWDVLAPGGILVSSVSQPDPQEAARRGLRGVFFLVAVTSAGLARIAELFDAGRLLANVGEVLPLAEARRAHAMLAGEPHKPGKIVLVSN